MHLVVTEPFGGFEKGDVITEGLDEILAEHSASVVKVADPAPSEEAAPLAPAPAAPAAPAEDPS